MDSERRTPQDPSAASADEHKETADDSASSQKHAKGLLAIGMFKLLKAVFFLALGFGALHLIHRDMGDLAIRVAAFLHIDPESQLMDALQDKLDLVNGRQLRLAGGGSILYAGISVVEGVGLMMERTWAEYLTIVVTTCGLPWEVYELLRRMTWLRTVPLAINLMVLGYLIWYLRRQRRLKAEGAQSEG